MIAGARQRLSVESAVCSDRGGIRAENQDAFGSFPELGLFVVADGMGGPGGGKAAGRAAVETIGAEVASAVDTGCDPRQMLIAAIEKANERIHRMSSARGALPGMGTTVTVVFVDACKVHIAHVGDTRVYQVRGNKTLQLTRDHGIVEELRAAGVLAGEVPKGWPLRHFLSRALGPRANVEVDYRAENVRPGDVIVICTDGVHRCVSQGDLGTCIGRAGSVAEMCRVLVAQARARGGRDNATALVLKWGPATC